MPAWLESWPFAWIYLFFVSGAAMRSQALYWLGRGVAAGSLRSASQPSTAGPAGRGRPRRLVDGWIRLIDGPQARRAARSIERWGMSVVPLSFLTVGFQSAVHGASGLLRLHWLRYTLWSVPGWFAWALIWAGGGTAAIYGAAALAARSPWALGAVATGLALAVAALVVRRRRRRDALSAVAGLGDHPADRATGASPGEGTRPGPADEGSGTRPAPGRSRLPGRA